MNNFDTINKTVTSDSLFSHLHFLNNLSTEEREELRLNIISLMSSFYDTGFEDGCRYTEDISELNQLMNQSLTSIPSSSRMTTYH